ELKWSDLCFSMFGVPRNTVVDFELFKALIHPADRERVLELIDGALHHGGDYDAEYRTVSPEGRMRWTSAKGRAFYDAQGRAARMEGIVLDITPRKEAERALRESEERFRHLAEGMPHMLWQLGEHGQLIYANPGWRDYVGRADFKRGELN